MADGDIILYRTPDGAAQVDLFERDGSVWLSQAKIAALYQISPQAITQHIRAIYAEGELTEATTCKQDLQVRTEGGRQVSRSIEGCETNLDRFISFNERPVLKSAGRISREEMVKIAHARYETFDTARKQSNARAADAEDLAELNRLETAARKAKQERKS